MNMQEIAAQALQLVKEYQDGNITADEYKELVKTLDYVKIVCSDTANLEENTLYRDMIYSAIHIASAIV
jgi:hypothetical protein